MKLKKSDLLYRWYVNYYSPIPAPTPTNLCSTFWTAILGNACKYVFDSSYGLYALWIISFLLGAVLVGIGYVTDSLNTWPIVAPVVLLGNIVFWLFVFFIAVNFGKATEKAPKWLKGLYCCGIFGIPVTCAIYNCSFTTFSEFFEFLKCLGIAVLCILGSAITITVVVVLINFIVRPIVTTRFFKMLGVFLWSLKKKVCPLIEVVEE